MYKFKEYLVRYRLEFQSLGLLLLLFFFCFSFLYHSDLSFNQDLGRHLKLGEIIWQTQNVPNTNLFSYTNTSFPFINHHWLFEVIIYLTSSSLGLQSLLIFKLLLLLLVSFIVIVNAYKSKSALYFSTTYIFLHLLRGRVDLRPEIFSFIFTLSTLLILERFHKKDSKLIYLLPLISLFWTNSHIYFPVGILLQLIFLIHLLIKDFREKSKKFVVSNKIKILLFITVLSILATLINPNFLKGAMYPFTVFGNYGVTITENQTVFTLKSKGFVNPDFFFYYLAAITALTSIYVGFWRTKFSFKNLGLIILGLALATQSIRGFPYLAIISLPYILRSFNIKRFPIWILLVNTIVALLLISESIYYLNGKYYDLTYKSHTTSLTLRQDARPALDFLLDKKLPQPIFNNFDIGSYVIYRAYPEYKVYIDGRPEAYPASFFEKTYLPMQENYDMFLNIDEEMDFKTVIFSLTDQNPRTINFLSNLVNDSHWKIVFLDQFMIIFVKNSEQTSYLKPIDITRITKNTYNYYEPFEYTNLSTFLANMNQLDTAQKITEKALVLSPDNPAANKVMAYILFLKKDNKTLNKYSSKINSWVFW